MLLNNNPSLSTTADAPVTYDASPTGVVEVERTTGKVAAARGMANLNSASSRYVGAGREGKERCEMSIDKAAD